MRTVAAKEHNPKLAQLDHRLSRFNDDRPIRVVRVFDFSVVPVHSRTFAKSQDSKPRLSGVLDTVRAAHVHSIAVPPEFLDPDVRTIMVSRVVECTTCFLL